MFDLDLTQPEADRRAWPRVKVTRPCKLFDPRSGKYLAGTTRDVSSGGIRVEIAQPLEINAGDSLHVGIAQKRRQMFIRASDMVELRIVRALRTPDGSTVIAGHLVRGAGEAVPLRRAA